MTELDPAQVQIMDEPDSQTLRIDGERTWLNSNTGLVQTTVDPAEIGATDKGKVVGGKKTDRRRGKSDRHGEKVGPGGEGGKEAWQRG